MSELDRAPLLGSPAGLRRDAPARGGQGRAVAEAALSLTLAVATAVFVAPRVLAVVYALGRHIASADLASDYVKGVLWAIALGVCIQFSPVSRSERRALLAVWLVKCVVTLGFMLLYEWNYDSLDAYAYFHASQAPRYDWSELRLGQDADGTRLVQAMAWLHARWLVSSYHAMKVTWSMIGMLGVFVLYRAACIVIGRRRPAIFVALACVPSILFWSSILGKDPIALFGIALVAYGLTAAFRGRPMWGLAAVAAGLPVAMAIRMWLGPILLAPLALVAVSTIRGWGRKVAALTAAIALCVGLLFSLRQRLALETFSESLEMLQTTSQSWAEGGSAQPIATNLSDPLQLLKFIPLGAATALFRPLPGEVMNAFGALAGLENGAVLVLLALAVTRGRLRELADPVFLWSSTFVVGWAVVYGPLSYQNLGTAVRFRLQVLPVMLLVLAYLARPRSPTGAVD